MMNPSEITVAQAEQALSSANLHGIVPINESWTPSLLLNLYRTVRNLRYGATFPPYGFRTTRLYVPVTYVQTGGDTMPPNWALSVCAVLRYVESDVGERHGVWFDKMGRFQFSDLQKYWSALANMHYAVRPVAHVTPRVAVHDALQRIDAAKYFPVVGLNLHSYIVVSDWLIHHAGAGTNADVLNEHEQHACAECMATFLVVMKGIGLTETRFVLPAVNWAHPGSYFRAWPLVERALALYHRGALAEETEVSALICTAVALKMLLRTARQVRHGACTAGNENNPSSSCAHEKQRNTSLNEAQNNGAEYSETSPFAPEPLFHVHTITASHTCAIAKRIAFRFPPAFESVISRVADRMASDATKIEPVPKPDVPPDAATDYTHLARTIRGMTATSNTTTVSMAMSSRQRPSRHPLTRTTAQAASLQPLFAYGMRRLFERKYGKDFMNPVDDTIDMSVARRELVSGWAGRAPCYAEGDKVETTSLFSNFALAAALLREKGTSWKREFVTELYRREVGLMNDEVDVGYDMMIAGRGNSRGAGRGLGGGVYDLAPASIGMFDAQGVACSSKHLGNNEGWKPYGRYAGCMNVSAYHDLLSQVDASIEEQKQYLSMERRLWSYHTEMDGHVYRIVSTSADEVAMMTTPGLKWRTPKCPRCTEGGDVFHRVATIFRSTRGKIGKRRFWAVGKQDCNGASFVASILDANVIIAVGDVKMDLRFGTKCRNCNKVSEIFALRGWPLGREQSWNGVFVPDLAFRESYN